MKIESRETSRDLREILRHMFSRNSQTQSLIGSSAIGRKLVSGGLQLPALLLSLPLRLLQQHTNRPTRTQLGESLLRDNITRYSGILCSFSIFTVLCMSTCVFLLCLLLMCVINNNNICIAVFLGVHITTWCCDVYPASHMVTTLVNIQ